MGVVQFIRSIFLLAIALGVAGTLVEATGCVGREAAIAHQHGGVSFKWLNQQLVGSDVTASGIKSRAAKKYRSQ